MTTNQLVYQAKLHWILFVWPIVLFLGSAWIGLNYDLLYPLALFSVLFALAWLGMLGMTYHFSSLIIKNKQIIIRTGFFMRQTIDIPLSKIESIDIRQSILGSILRYGSIIITGTGGTKQVVNYLDKPLTCRRQIEQLMHYSQ